MFRHNSVALLGNKRRGAAVKILEYALIFHREAGWWFDDIYNLLHMPHRHARKGSQVWFE